MNISKYAKRGFVGVDVSLEISLCEYGLIWKEFKYNLTSNGRQIKKGEILAICLRPTDSTPTDCDTDYGYFTKEGLLSEDWIDWESVGNYEGLNIENLQSQDTGNLLFSLIGYYGQQNFF